jgi:hypothetical protein
MPETHNVTSIQNEGRIPHCRNSLKYNWTITNTGKIETPNIYTWPLTFLSWYRHFNKKWRVKASEYISPWMRFKLTTLVLIGTDCIDSWIYNYHTHTTTTVPCLFGPVESCRLLVRIAKKSFKELYVKNKLHFNEMMILVSSLCQHARLDFYNTSSIKQQSAVDMFLHSGKLLWLPTNQSLLLLLNAECLS